MSSIFMRSPSESSRTMTFILSATSSSAVSSSTMRVERARFDAVDRAVEFQRLARGQVPPERVFLAHEQRELPLHLVLALPGREAEHARAPGGGVEQAGEHLEHGGFARAVRPEEADEFALVDAEADARRRRGFHRIAAVANPLMAPHRPCSLR